MFTTVVAGAFVVTFVVLVDVGGAAALLVPV